jgi:hypothetical protein
MRQVIAEIFSKWRVAWKAQLAQGSVIVEATDRPTRQEHFTRSHIVAMIGWSLTQPTSVLVTTKVAFVDILNEAFAKLAR